MLRSLFHPKKFSVDDVLLLFVIRLKMPALVSYRELLFSYGMVMDIVFLDMVWLWCNYC